MSCERAGLHGQHGYKERKKIPEGFCVKLFAFTNSGKHNTVKPTLQNGSDFSSSVSNNKCAYHTGPQVIVHLSRTIDFSLSPACKWSKSAYPEDIILN